MYGGVLSLQSHLDTAFFDITLHFKLMCDHIDGVFKLLNIICGPSNR